MGRKEGPANGSRHFQGVLSAHILLLTLLVSQFDKTLKTQGYDISSPLKSAKVLRAVFIKFIQEWLDISNHCSKFDSY